MVTLPQWVHLLPENLPNCDISITGDSCYQNFQTFSLECSDSVYSIAWNFGDPSSGANNTSTAINPTHEFSDLASYQITAIVEFNCHKDTITQNISLLDCPEPLTPTLPYEFPNVITPNSDGANDFFAIENLPENTEVIILNRWGNVVFSSTNYQNNCNGEDNSGTTLLDGVYTYKYTTEAGTIGHGFVHLVR
ncbi:MAG: gliding motility-associated C-terminal domain-containing protein [Bacteroidetes bacterium]|nr:gliding motility-associated C-terminal domain-containing protein [Bacteroidota bacterium]